MDDSVLAQFQSTFLIAGEVQEAARPLHPHYTLYKAKGEAYGNQEARRRAFLEDQQQRRRNFADHARRIADGDFSEEESDDGMEEGAFDEVDAAAPEAGAMETTKKSAKKKKKYPYRNQLMLSEWLVEVPADFEENWLAVVVPVGRRSMVVAARKTTSAYSRAGDLIKNFPSLLPGGCKHTHRLARDYTILDCVFYEGSRTYFILDAMCWGGHPVYDSDLEFRTFWKEQKCKEFPQISTYSRINPLTFQNLPYHSCSKENLTKLLSEAPPFEVDGLLFIHKQCRYITGLTPLASWLKPHMIPDILGIPVSAEFLDKSPDLSAGKEKMDTGKKSPGKKKPKSSSHHSMETCDEAVTEGTSPHGGTQRGEEAAEGLTGKEGPSGSMET